MRIANFSFVPKKITDHHKLRKVLNTLQRLEARYPTEVSYAAHAAIDAYYACKVAKYEANPKKYGERAYADKNLFVARQLRGKSYSRLPRWMEDPSIISAVRDLTPAKKVDPAKLRPLAFLGEGSDAEVFLCQDPAGEFFAVKRLKSIRRNPNEVDFVRTEYAINSAHIPHTVQCYGTYFDAHHIYHILDFMPGGDLNEVPGNGVHEDSVKIIAAEVLVGILALHKSHILHRDIKTRNILIDANGHLRLADFGIAKKTEARTSTFVGTPHYMAPEILRGEAYDERVDAWSFGVLLYILTQGRPPFDHPNQAILFDRVMHQPLSFRWGSPQLQLLITGLLDKDSVTRLSLSKAKQYHFFDGIDWGEFGAMTNEPEFENVRYSRRFADHTEEELQALRRLKAAFRSPTLQVWGAKSPFDGAISMST